MTTFNFFDLQMHFSVIGTPKIHKFENFHNHGGIHSFERKLNKISADIYPKAGYRNMTGCIPYVNHERLGLER